jgi:hypothetical protein
MTVYIYEELRYVREAQIEKIVKNTVLRRIFGPKEKK